MTNLEEVVINFYGYVRPLFVNKHHLINMAFNSEVALFNLLEDAQTADELLAVIDDYLSEEEV